MIHNLKIKPNFFEDVLHHHKRFEFRKNDRNYHVGDMVNLQEYKNGEYTGREIHGLITYILDNKDFNQCGDYVILGLAYLLYYPDRDFDEMCFKVISLD